MIRLLHVIDYMEFLTFLLAVQEANTVISKVIYNHPSNKYRLLAWDMFDSSLYLNQIYLFIFLRTFKKGLCDSQKRSIWDSVKVLLKGSVCSLAPGPFSLFLKIRQIFIRCKSHPSFPKSSDRILLHVA